MTQPETPSQPERVETYAEYQQKRGAPLTFYTSIASHAYQLSATRDDVRHWDAMYDALAAIEDAGHPVHVARVEELLTTAQTSDAENRRLQREIKAWKSCFVNAEARCAEIVDCGNKLSAKIDECEPHLADAFMHRYLRCGDYTGPTFGKELEAFKAALAAAPDAGDKEPHHG